MSNRKLLIKINSLVQSYWLYESDLPNKINHKRRKRIAKIIVDLIFKGE